MDRFEKLPEDCISKILSLTSPVDAARLSLISKVFKSAADSDFLWEAFLPSDLQDSISRTWSPPVYATKKELYLSLCDSPLILDGGKLSFSLDKWSGKNCYVVAAKELIVCWGDSPWCWTWTSYSNSRFSEVANLNSVCWLDIRGRLETKKLSPRTYYAAYLVFQLTKRCYGLEFTNSVIKFVNHEKDSDAQRRASTLHLAPWGKLVHERRQKNGKVPGRRADGWLEVEMGTFYNDQGDDGKVESRLFEIKHLHEKSGLIVEGIEFRPL